MQADRKKTKLKIKKQRTKRKKIYIGTHSPEVAECERESIGLGAGAALNNKREFLNMSRRALIMYLFFWAIMG